jgi:hypothetical protein
VGLRNTQARLRHLYSGDATFSFALSDTHTATATIVLPKLSSHSGSANFEGQVTHHAGIDHR